MTTLQLKNHPVWQDLTEILENLDPNTLAKEILEECFYTINGYWDEEDKYYESITLPSNTTTELISSFVGFSNNKRFLKLAFSLLAYFSPIQEENQPRAKIGELVIIYNENMEFIDENWILEIDSPLLQKR
ncbi:hypothetical protein [Sphaerospermopsis sp. LEGE 08334]|jgi:hypothetical protein|uniref:hypothetical protein n=1 Tax=Sphaerospermopsis sp. LEGE 08334 TaxID=1828651 RepID=UPI00187ED0D8|nr:hypothetical protein [Sphaerospermopsis sp. LEGE 08334]MBE9058041.1 hypothetical protein [Sphaerospermopsis sp. LEGE 08334]